MASEIGVQTIQHTNGTDAMTIDSSGRVLTPARPAFRLALGSVQSISGTDAVTLTFADQGASDQCFIQGGITVSSGVVTVPVAGVYSLHFALRIDGVGSGGITARLSINNQASGQNTIYVIISSPASGNDNLTGSGVFKLDANDTVRVTIDSSADTSYNANDRCEFSGFLVG